MKLARTLTRITLAAALLAAVSACTVVPAHPGAYRAPPVYVETYPAYGYSYPSTNIYYGSGYRRDYGYGYDNRYRDDHRRHDAHRHQESRHYDSPLESAARTHRNVRRSLGLPRLPGMP